MSLENARGNVQNRPFNGWSNRLGKHNLVIIIIVQISGLIVDDRASALSFLSDVTPEALQLLKDLVLCFSSLTSYPSWCGVVDGNLNDNLPQSQFCSKRYVWWRLELLLQKHVNITRYSCAISPISFTTVSKLLERTCQDGMTKRWRGGKIGSSIIFFLWKVSLIRTPHWMGYWVLFC